MIAIEEAKDQDLAAVYNLLKEFAKYLDESEKMTLSLADFVSCKDIYKCLLAKVGKEQEVAGCMLCYYSFDSWAGRAIHMDGLFVKEEFRGQNIGKLMMNALVAFAKQNSCKRITWTVREDNSGAIEFYKEFGACVGDDRLNCSVEL